MGKSSSKKKRSKNSSQSRTRKKNKVKSRRKKSKKLQRLCDGSVSYSSDSDSRSSLSFSSSSFKDEYRSRRSRPRSRNKKDMKHGKKRARRQSSSRKSSEDSPRLKKCRGSRRDDDYEKWNRTSKKKRSRRYVSVSSSSSGSQSYSTCRSGSSSDHDDIRVKKRGRPGKEKDRRRSENVKRGSKRTWDRSRSCSSCSRYDEGGDHPIEERLTEESYPRRLKSVITVVQYENESSRELNTDDVKEVYDYDDYPSCRSNDSNDGRNQRDLPQHSHAISETKGPLDDEQEEFFDIGTSSLEESGKDCKPSYNVRENNKVPSDSGGLNGDDMESILRQRALENLKKFRGGLQRCTNPPMTLNDGTDSVGNAPSCVNTVPFCIKTPKGDDAGVIASQLRQQIKQPPVGRDSTILPKNDKKTSHLNDVGKDTGTVRSGLASPSSQVTPATIPRVEVNSANSSVSYKSKLVTLRARQEQSNTHTVQKQEARLEPSNTCTTQKQEATAQEPSQAKLVSMSSVNDGGFETAQTGKLSEDNAGISVSNRPKSVKSRIRREPPISTQKRESVALEPSEAKLVPESTVNEDDYGTAQTVKPPEHSDNGDKVENSHVPACDNPPSTSTSGHTSSDKPEDGTKDDSQLQQKTMSVMRGGEMVQVNYQVYIPKRAPALARRRLKR